MAAFHHKSGDRVYFISWGEVRIGVIEKIGPYGVLIETNDDSRYNVSPAHVYDSKAAADEAFNRNEVHEGDRVYYLGEGQVNFGIVQTVNPDGEVLVQDVDDYEFYWVSPKLVYHAELSAKVALALAEK